MLKYDVDNSQELANLLFDLTQGEGDSVQICHPNPDSYLSPSHDSTIFVIKNFGKPVQYFGNSIIHCLIQAKENK